MMPAPIDLSGQRFGKLLVIERVSVHPKYLSPHWVCKCDCGNTVNVLISNLRNGNSTSCGCGRKEALLKARTTHGMRHSDEYRIWLGMKDRCYNPKNPNYHHYGGRGVVMCDEWKESFEAFYRDIGPRPSKEHSVERGKNDEGYSRDNCEWATRVEQGNNRRSNIIYEHAGRKQTLAQWCRELKLPYKRVYYRMKRDGWSFEKAITTPIA